MTQGTVALAAICAFVFAAAAPAAAAPLQVDAHVVIGFTTVNGSELEAAGLVEGRPFRRGAIELRSTLVNGTASGRFTLFDGRGSLRGRARTHSDDGSTFTGAFTVEAGSGRYARAAGTLRFAGTLDPDSVPAVTVLPGKLEGRLRVRPAEPKPPLTKPLAVDFRGKGAKVRFKQISADPFMAKLTSAGATAMNRFGNGVLIETDDVTATPLRPKVVTWYGPDGTWSAKGITNLDTGPMGSDPLRVTGGTGRYRGARGRLAYTLLTPPGVSGLTVSRLRGRLRFPG